MLNEREEAIRWLEKAYQERSVMLVTLKNFWVWDNLREDARFQAIYERMNFPASLVKETKLQAVNTTPIDHALLTASEIAHYLSQLKQLVETEQAYLDPNLSLRGLAAQLNLHSNKLSWLLNEEIGKNFNEYINAFRLATFKEKALLPANSHYTILGLAYESGFNSKTVFNGFFKKMEGMTPKVWVRSQSK
jgi:AraC-like DNA-binding protein